MRAFALALVLFAAQAAHADFDAGERARARGDFALALKEWQAAAEAGDLRAQHGLGQLLLMGDGVRPDPRGAAAWFRRAADKGHADSQFALGQMMRDGVAMRADATASYALFVRAARQGHAGARYAIGSLFEQGLGVPFDDARALAWYRLAAEAGHPYAVERGNRLRLNSSAEKISESERYTLESLMKTGI